MAMLTSAAVAQSYFDDDIYYDAAKAKKEKAEKAAKAAKAKAEAQAAEEVHLRYLESIVDTEAGSDREVDEYNRRSGYTPTKEQAADLGDNFTYTRRIEQFSNPDIVVNSNDDDLKYYYVYANDELAGSTGSTSPTTINIYVDNIDPWGDFWSPYFYSSAWSWARRPAYYNPWWSYNYWHYGPSWNWGWSWGWNDPWYPPTWGWAPPRPPHYNPDGWNRPGAGHRPGFNGGTHGRPSVKPGSSSSAGRRPTGTRPTVSGTTGRPVSGRPSGVSSSNTGRRPTGNATPSYNPSNSTRPGQSNTATYQRGGTRRSSAATSSSSSSSSHPSYNSYQNSGRRSSASTSGSSYNSGRSSSSYGSGRTSSGGGRSSSGSGGGRSSGSGRSGGGRR